MFIIARSSHRALLTLAASLLLALVAAGTALAHEHREVGSYEIEVGWRNEPAYVNQPNGLHLGVMSLEEANESEEGEHEEVEGEDAHGSGGAVENLVGTLQAEIIFGDQTRQLELRSVSGEPGVYTADILPTVPGSYIFHIFGNIEGNAIDETFNSADGSFSDIEPLDELQFPETANALGGQTLVASQQDVNNARLFGIGGLVLGALGLLVGVMALVRR